MSRIVFYSFISVFMVAFLASGCNNVCDGVTCNNGECADGECVCFDGYEGENCEFTANAKFSGTYHFSRVCDSGTVGSLDTVQVQPVDGSTELFTLSGLDGCPELEAGIKSDGVEFEIVRQSIGGGLEIESISGTISTDANTINLNYQILNSQSEAVVERCSGSMVK